MNNDFDRDRLALYYIDNYECWVCGKNNQDVFHHILGRKSKSIFNSAPVHNQICHLYNAQLNNKSYKSYLLKKTRDFLFSKDVVLLPEDVEFLEKYKEYYMEELKDFSILETPISGITLRDMSAITFVQWAITKVSGCDANDSRVQTITRMASGIFGRTMPDEQKLQIVNNLISLGVEIK